MNQFQKIIEEICKEEKIQFSLLSKDWIIMLEKEKITKFIAGFKFDLNEHGLGNVFDDKYATYEVLKNAELPVIQHHILFPPKNEFEYAKSSNKLERAYQLFERYNQNIILKSNVGTCGDEVYHITKKEELKPCLEKLFQTNFSISLCPFYQIKREYRMIILKNECKLLYGKIPPIIKGDGTSTIKELLLSFNPNIKEEQLKEEKYQQILKKNETFIYNWKNNLSKGAIPAEVDENTKLHLLKLLEQIKEKIPLGFCSVDIIETTENEFLILEINSGVMMNNYMNFVPNGRQIAKKIYQEAIKEMIK